MYLAPHRGQLLFSPLGGATIQFIYLCETWITTHTCKFTVHLFTTLRTFETTPYVRVNFLTRKRGRDNVITIIGLAKPSRSHLLTLVSSTNLHIFPTAVCLLIVHRTSPTVWQLRSFTDSTVVHLSVDYHMVKGISHTPPLLLSTLFLSKSALLILSLLSNLELKLTFSVSPLNSLNLSVVVIAFSVL